MSRHLEASSIFSATTGGEATPLPPSPTNLYDTLLASGATLDHHESDLYVFATESALAIVRASNVPWSIFQSEADGKLWIDVPFEYMPFWRRVVAAKRSSADG